MSTETEEAAAVPTKFGHRAAALERDGCRQREDGEDEEVVLRAGVMRC